MLTYNGWGFTWVNGHLDTASNTGNNISYQYNADGIRTSKTVNGVTTNYTLDGNNNITSQSDGVNTLGFTYDSNGKLETMTLNGVKYTYETNAQGDITGLVDSSGNEVVTYSYDSWGNLLSIKDNNGNDRTNDTTFVGYINPFRYRGYYYDSETGLYLLQSRYYNPELGRFISKDDPSYHDGTDGVEANLYAYANNNPVMYSDADGHGTVDTLLNILNIILIFVTFVTPAKIPVIALNLAIGGWFLGWSIYYLVQDAKIYKGSVRTTHIVIDSINLIMAILGIVCGVIGIQLRLLESMRILTKVNIIRIVCDVVNAMFGVPWTTSSAIASGTNTII